MSFCVSKTRRNKLIGFLMCMLHVVLGIKFKYWGHSLLPTSYFSLLSVQYLMPVSLSVHLYSIQRSTLSCPILYFSADLLLLQVQPCYQVRAVLGEIRLTALYLVLEISCMSLIVYFHMASSTPTSVINCKVQACMQITASCRRVQEAPVERNGQLIPVIFHEKWEVATFI